MTMKLLVCGAFLFSFLPGPQVGDVAALAAKLLDASPAVRDAAEADLMKCGTVALRVVEEVAGRGDADTKARALRIAKAAAFVDALGYPSGRDLALEPDPWKKLEALAASTKMLDAVSGPKVGDAIVMAFPWAESYDDKSHQRDLFALREKYVEKNRVPNIGWVFSRLLRHGAADVRLHAVVGLESLGLKDQALPIFPLLKDGDARVRNAAASALLEADAGSYAKEVAGLLEDKDALVRRHVLLLLARYPGLFETDRVVAQLDDKDDVVREYAASALDGLGVRSAIPLVRSRIETEKNRRVKEALQSTLKSLESANGERRAVAVVKEWMSAKSHVESAEYHRITDPASWETLWNRHDTSARSPEVDFASNMVVAIFQGKGWNSDGVYCVSAWEDDATLRVRYDERSYQTAGPDGGGVRVSSCGFIVLPKSAKTLVLEENVQGLIGGAPVWKERARLP
jgi:hypothetical protein